jgi:hypothetical protein
MHEQPIEWEVDGYIATLTPATDSLPGGCMRIEIRAKDISVPPFSRIFYYDEATERHYRNFARKFATDPVYREQCLTGTAPWQEVDIRYRERAAELYAIFARKDPRFLPSVDYTPEKQAIHEKLWREYQNILQRIYQWLKFRLNPPPSRTNHSAKGSTGQKERKLSSLAPRHTTADSSA